MAGRSPRVTVFTPSPYLTVTVEATGDGRDEIHLHGGGQGVWIARMLVKLGCDTVLCGAFGGESGGVLVGLIEREDITVRRVAVPDANGVYVHDRRAGERRELAESPPPVLHRHELDELYNATLVEALDSDVAVLAGPDHPRLLAPDTYRRLAGDLAANDVRVIVDLSGPHLIEAVAGGVFVAKASHEDLLSDGMLRSAEEPDVVRTLCELADRGARNVVVTLAEKPARALLGRELVEVAMPPFEPVDARGAGDSFTAGIAAATARGAGLRDALRLAAAAGALNTTRRGLATGNRELIERLAERVDVRSIE